MQERPSGCSPFLESSQRPPETALARTTKNASRPPSAHNDGKLNPSEEASASLSEQMMTMMTMMTTGYIDDIRAWDETLASRAATPSVGDCEASATLPNSPPADPPGGVDTPP